MAMTASWVQMKKVLERMSLKRRDNVGREVGARRAHLAKMMDERMTGELTEIEFEHQVRLGSLFGNLCPRTLCSTALALCLDPRTLNALCIEQRLWNTGCIDPRTLNRKPDQTGAEA